MHDLEPLVRPQSGLSSDVAGAIKNLRPALAFATGIIALLCSFSVRAALPPACLTDADHYRYTPELYEAMNAIAARFPDLAEVIDYGDSYLKTRATGGYDLRALHITNRGNTVPKPVAFFMAGQHGNELPPPEMLMRFANWLLNGYGKDPQITFLVDEHDIWIVPSSNPDQLGAERLSARAVDLNRNHSYQWVLNGRLHGSTPASEPETLSLETLAARVFGSTKSGSATDPIPLGTPGILVNIHGYLNAVSYPWSYSTTLPPNEKPFKALAARIAKFNGYRSGQAAAMHYTAAGTANDFAFGLLGVSTLLFEIDGVARPPYASIDNNYWPVNQGAFALLVALSRAPLQLIDGPELTQLSLVAENGTFKLSATAQGTRVIDGFEYFLDMPPWRENAITNAMRASDGIFDKSVESAEATLSIDGLETRKHLVYVRARDITGLYGPVRAIWLNLDPNTAPEVVVTSPSASAEVMAYTPITFAVESFDAQGDSLTHSWALDGKMVQACAASSFTYIPSDGDIGSRQVTVQISDGVNVASHTWQVSVATNSAITPVILDDGGVGTTQTGIWTTLTSSTAYGTRTRYSDAVSAAYMWSPTLSQGGHHAVYARWPLAKTGGTAVPFTITHDGGASVVYVNQRDAGLANRWNLLGIFPLTQGANGQVRVSTAGGRSFADAVLWAPSIQPSMARESVVDSIDTAATIRTGTWTSSTANKPWGGSALISSGVATFRWVPPVAAPGSYDVYAWWTQGSTRPVNAPYRIVHAEGETVVNVNQRDPNLGGRWNYLGKFRFDLLGAAVELSSASGTVSADAVRFLPATAP